MKYLCECTYCGFKWYQVFYSRPDRLQCEKRGCHGRNDDIILRKASDIDTDVFGYNK